MKRRTTTFAVVLAASAVAGAAWIWWSSASYLVRVKRETTKETMRALHQAIVTFHLKKGRLPLDLRELCDGTLGMDEPPKDAWRNEFVFRAKPDGDYDLLSYGADGAPGGEGADRDIDLAEVRGK